MAEYKRRSVEKAIIMALRDLGRSASRKTIANNEYDGVTYDQVNSTKESKTGIY